MIEKESVIALSKILNVSQDRFAPFTTKMKDALSSYIESENGSIFMFQDIITHEKYVIKVKSKEYYTEFEKKLNLENDEYFKQQFYKGYAIFLIKFAHIREITIYSNNDTLLQTHIPLYLGNRIVGNSTYIVMKYIDFFPELPLLDKTEIAICFLARLHSRFFKQYKKLDSMQLNILSPQLFSENKYLLKSVFKTAIEQSELPQQLTKEISNYIDRLECEFADMQNNGLTLCHCDFAFRNITFDSGKPIIIDWELATALEPHFDLVEFLVDYPMKLNAHIIDYIIDKYISHIDFLIDSADKSVNFYISMQRNLYHYFVVRQAFLLVINKIIPMHWTNDSIRNYITLWEHIVKR